MTAKASTRDAGPASAAGKCGEGEKREGNQGSSLLPPRLWPETHQEHIRLQRRKAPRLEVFSSFRLTDDPDALQYLVSDEVVFPKPHRKVVVPFRKPELDNLWLSGFLDHAHREKVKKVYQQTTTASRSEISVASAGSPGVPETGIRDDDDDNSENRKFIPAITSTGMALALSRRAYRHHQGGRKRRAEGRKGSRFLATKVVRPDLRCAELDHLYETSRQEHESAIRIQRCYRRHVVWERWRQRWKRHLAAIKIQRVGRGMVTRGWVALWHSKRLRVCIQLQARARRVLAVKKWMPQKTLERAMAIKIQSVIRMYLAKCVACKRRHHMAAIRIQRLWKGVMGRAAADRLYLCKKVTVIQRFTRRFLAQEYYKRRRKEAVDAVTTIQRAFRGWFSRKTRNRLLRERMLENRRFHGHMLASEDDFHQARLRILGKRLAQSRILDRLADAKKRWEQCLHVVEEAEVEYMAFHRKRRLISPRDFVGGWDQEFSKNIVNFRDKITQDKLHALLDVAGEMRKLQEEVDAKHRHVDDEKLKIRLLSRWRDEEDFDLVEDEKRKRFEEEIDNRRKKVALQRRRWKVKHYTQSGKPDKLRPMGRPWDPSVLAGPERDVFCSGSADIFAFINRDPCARIGSDSSRDNAFARLYLTCFMGEIQRVHQLFDPLYRLVQTSLPAQALPPDMAMDPVEACHPCLPPPLQITLGSTTPSSPAVEHEPSSLPPSPTSDLLPTLEATSPRMSRSMSTDPLSLDADQEEKEEENRDGSHGVLSTSAPSDVIEASSPNSQVTQGSEGEAAPEHRVSSVMLGPGYEYISSLPPVEPAPSPRRVPYGYHTIRHDRILTDHRLWPIRDAESRIQVSSTHKLTQARILHKYEGHVHRYFTPPVTKVPWSLVDELEAEAARWEAEKRKLHFATRDRMMASLPWSPHKTRTARPPSPDAMVPSQTATGEEEVAATAATSDKIEMD